MTEREEELAKEGWQRRFMASEPRLSEMAQMCEEPGFEVHLELLELVEEPNQDSEKCQQCKMCFEGFEDQYKVIFTRPKSGNERKIE